MNSSGPAGPVPTENATENQNKPTTDSKPATPRAPSSPENLSADADKPPGESADTAAPAETAKDQADGRASGWVQASRFSYVGIFFGVAVFLGFLFGRWLDRKFGTDPWLMLVGVLFGIASGFKELYRLTASYRTEQKKKP